MASIAFRLIRDDLDTDLMNGKSFVVFLGHVQSNTTQLDVELCLCVQVFSVFIRAVAQRSPFSATHTKQSGSRNLVEGSTWGSGGFAPMWFTDRVPAQRSGLRSRLEDESFVAVRRLRKLKVYYVFCSVAP